VVEPASRPGDPRGRRVAPAAGVQSHRQALRHPAGADSLGANSTVFDETLALSTLWLERFSAGLVVSSAMSSSPSTRPGLGMGPAREWSARPSASPWTWASATASMSSTSAAGCTPSCKSPPRPRCAPPAASCPRCRIPGSPEEVALDTGLLHFDAPLSAGLSRLGFPRFRRFRSSICTSKFTHSLTGEVPCALPELGAVLHGSAFHCSLVAGAFTHVGTTAHFRRLFTGGVVDSILAPGSELGPGAPGDRVSRRGPSRGRGPASRTVSTHAFDNSPAGLIAGPEDTVVHQVPVQLPDGRRGFVVRTYGVDRRSQDPCPGSGAPILDVLEDRSISTRKRSGPALRSGTLPLERPAIPVRQHGGAPPVAGTSTLYADREALASARDRRRDANWRLPRSPWRVAETDVRPLLLHAPGIHALAETAAPAHRGNGAGDGRSVGGRQPLLSVQSLLRSGRAWRGGRASPFGRLLRRVPGRGRAHPPRLSANGHPRSAPSSAPVTVSAPARMISAAAERHATILPGLGRHRLQHGHHAEWRLPHPHRRPPAAGAGHPPWSLHKLSSRSPRSPFPPPPMSGSPFAIHRAALEMLGFVTPGEPVAGLEIRTEVNRPWVPDWAPPASSPPPCSKRFSKCAVTRSPSRISPIWCSLWNSS